MCLGRLSLALTNEQCAEHTGPGPLVLPPVWLLQLSMTGSSAQHFAKSTNDTRRLFSFEKFVVLHVLSFKLFSRVLNRASRSSSKLQPSDTLCLLSEDAVALCVFCHKTTQHYVFCYKPQRHCVSFCHKPPSTFVFELSSNLEWGVM